MLRRPEGVNLAVGQGEADQVTPGRSTGVRLEAIKGQPQAGLSLATIAAVRRQVSPRTVRCLWQGTACPVEGPGYSGLLV